MKRNYLIYIIIYLLFINHTYAQKTIPRAQATNLIANLSWNTANEYAPTSGNNSSLPNDITNPSNAGKTAIISNSFIVTGAFAANQIIVPQGGSMSGTGININGATIAINFQQAFASSARFSSLYPENKGCLFPELFGGGPSVNNSDAIEAMILNSVCGYNKTNTIYPFNNNKTIIRTGLFKWNGNNSTLSVGFIDSGTSLYAIDFRKTELQITDLIFDGKGDRSSNPANPPQNGCKRMLQSVDSDLSIDNVTVKNVISTTGAIQDRGIAISVYTDFTTGDNYKIYNSTFENIVSYGDGTVASNALTGLSKALLFTYKDLTTTTTGNVDIDSCIIDGILGDDADGIFFSSSYEGGAGRYINQINHYVNNCTFSNCARRFIKGIESQLNYTNNTFNSMSPSQVANGLGNVYPPGSIKDEIDVSGQTIPYTPTTGVTMGSHATNPVNYFSYNSTVMNNVFNAHPDGAVQSGTGGADQFHTIYKGNVFNFPKLSVYAGIGLGTGPHSDGSRGSKYDGVIIEDNTFVNCGMNIYEMRNLESVGWTRQYPKNITIQNNIFNYTVNLDGEIRGIFQTNVTTSRIIDTWFINNTVNFNYPHAYTNFGGIVGPRWAGPTFAGLHVEDNVINMTGNTTNQKLVHVLGNFGSSNSFSNNTICGLTTTINDAFLVVGDSSFINSGNVTATDCSNQPTATCTDGIQNGDETGIDCGGSTCSACEDIWLEAECATVGLNWSVISDTSASNGQYLIAPSGNSAGQAPTDPNSYVTFTVNVPNAGSYSVHGRVIAPTGSNDSFWVRANNENWYMWNNIASSTSFQWDQVHDTNQTGAPPITLNLQAGTNTVQFAHREEGTSLDKIYLTNASNTPSGIGNSDPSCIALGPPIADAGADQNISSPTNSVLLTGTGSDPDGGNVSYQWSQTSGPNTASLTGDTTAQLTADGLITGVYVFQLTVTDDESETAFDEVSVTLSGSTTGPVVTSISVTNLTETSFKVDWTLDQGSTGRVEWGLTSALGNQTILESNFLTHHVQTVSGLNAGTEYFYRVIGEDQSGNTLAGTTNSIFTLGPPIANAGSDQNISSPTNTILLTGAGSDPDGGNVSYQWSQTSGPNTASLTGDTTAQLTADGLITGVYVFRLTVTDDESETAFDEVSVTLSGDTASPVVTSISVTDLTETSFKVDWTLDESSTGRVEWGLTSALGNQTILESNFLTHHIQTVSGLTPGTEYFYRIIGEDASGNTLVGTTNSVFTLGPPIADAGADQNISSPTNSVLLTGTGSDPDGENVSYQWSQTNGPNTANLTGDTTAQLTADGLITGVYVFRLTVTDDESETAFDEVSVTLSGDTAEPVVTSISITDLTETSFKVDWTLDEGSTGRVEWGLTSALGNQTILESNFLTHHIQTVSGLTPGTEYFYRIIGEDASGNTLVGTTNSIFTLGPPIADAGSDQNISSPTNSILLTGTGSDPDGGTVSYQWSQTSGPNTASLTGDTTAQLSVNGLIPGVYVFQLSVTDDEGDSITDTTNVTVMDNTCLDLLLNDNSAIPITSQAPLYWNGSKTIEGVSDNTNGSDCALKLQKNVAGDTYGGYRMIIDLVQNNISAGDNISFILDANGVSGNAVVKVLGNNTNAQTLINHTYGQGQGWASHSEEITVPSGASELFIWLYPNIGSAAVGYSLFDNLNVQKVQQIICPDALLNENSAIPITSQAPLYWNGSKTIEGVSDNTNGSDCALKLQKNVTGDSYGGYRMIIDLAQNNINVGDNLSFSLDANGISGNAVVKVLGNNPNAQSLISHTYGQGQGWASHNEEITVPSGASELFIWLYPNIGSAAAGYSLFDNLVVTKVNSGSSSKSAVSQTNALLNSPENSPIEVLSVYPNPSRNEVNIDLPATLEYNDYSLFSVNGALVKKGSITPGQTNISILIADLEKGMYIIHLSDKKGNTKILKLMKEE